MVFITCGLGGGCGSGGSLVVAEIAKKYRNRHIGLTPAEKKSY